MNSAIHFSLEDLAVMKSSPHRHAVYFWWCLVIGLFGRFTTRVIRLKLSFNLSGGHNFSPFSLSLYKVAAPATAPPPTLFERAFI
ncbi:hypothetical protein HanXRQr2_Chr04g0150611 [Helianthus annuus]|uniref:Uncharacterized protein n=2 Tax=Helianthus annuus TaxID=4232 RepID=A0A9K3NRJ7_HELAN|nr:hypothetical protein HanXRQr2_Chr04g0150611 [Helianthus annuus]